MKKFKLWQGLAGLFVGFIIWFLMSVIAGLDQGITGKQQPIFSYGFGFIIMIIIPLWYWALRIPYMIGKEKEWTVLKYSSIALWWLLFLLMFLFILK